MYIYIYVYIYMYIYNDISVCMYIYIYMWDTCSHVPKGVPGPDFKDKVNIVKFTETFLHMLYMLDFNSGPRLCWQTLIGCWFILLIC